MTLNRFPVAYELPGMPGLGGVSTAFGSRYMRLRLWRGPDNGPTHSSEPVHSGNGVAWEKALHERPLPCRAVAYFVPCIENWRIEERNHVDTSRFASRRGATLLPVAFGVQGEVFQVWRWRLADDSISLSPKPCRMVVLGFVMVEPDRAS